MPDTTCVDLPHERHRRRLLLALAAAAIPGVRVVRAPVDPATTLVDLDFVRAHIGRNTVLLVGSAGNYPYGTIDPIEALSELAALHGVVPAAITLGNGSNDVLDMIARVFLGPGVEAVYSQHAFAVYPIAVQAVGAEAMDQCQPAGLVGRIERLDQAP